MSQNFYWSTYFKASYEKLFLIHCSQFMNKYAKFMNKLRGKVTSNLKLTMG